MPCRATWHTSPGPSPEFLRAALSSTACWGPFGAVIPLERPSWLTADDTRTGRGRLLLVAGSTPGELASRAKSWVFLAAPLACQPSTTVAAPSPRPYPSQLLSRVRHLPVHESACRVQNTENVPEYRRRLDPEAIAPPHSPARILAWAT